MATPSKKTKPVSKPTVAAHKNPHAHAVAVTAAIPVPAAKSAVKNLGAASASKPVTKAAARRAAVKSGKPVTTAGAVVAASKSPAAQTAKSSAKSTKSAANPVVKPAAKPIAKSVVKPTTKPAVKPVEKPAAKRPVTLGDWLKHAISRYKATGAALGQVATNAHDEALYLLLRTLALPLDSKPSVLKHKLTTAEVMAVENVLTRRLEKRIPAAYLTREAFLGEYRFYVDERVIIPRSYFLEIIPQQLNAWLPDPAKVKRVVDVCTGSGCLAILLAHHFPQAKVDAIDLSPDALAVARINVKNHQLARRITLHESDVFDAVPKAKYDVIISNPPYEPTAHCKQLPPEFNHEPMMALDGGKDGLDVIRKFLRQARDRLQPHGVVLIEVGGLQPVMDKEFAALDLYWMHTADGCNCVCLIQAARLKAWKG